MEDTALIPSKGTGVRMWLSISKLLVCEQESFLQILECCKSIVLQTCEYWLNILNSTCFFSSSVCSLVQVS